MLEKLSLTLGLPKVFVCISVVLLAGSLAEYIIRNLFLNIPYFKKKQTHRLEKRLMREAKMQVDLDEPKYSYL